MLLVRPNEAAEKLKRMASSLRRSLRSKTATAGDTSSKPRPRTKARSRARVARKALEKESPYVAAATPRLVQTRTLTLYSPHAAQLNIHQSTARFIVACWGRQSGKSTYALNKLLDRAWSNPGKTYWFIAPTFGQALVQYRRLASQLFSCKEVMLKKNQTELRIKLINGAQIVCKSGEVFDNLRTETLDGVVIDEVRDQRPELWPLVIRPMLLTTGGWCDFISTPNGFDAFYDLAEKARLDTTGRWAYYSAPSTCNPLISQDEIEDMKSSMTEAQFAQEVLAQFVNLRQGKAYSQAGPHNEALASPFVQDGFSLFSPFLPVVVGLDFNVNPMSWHLGQFRARQSYWFDEIHVEDTNTHECAKILVERLKALGGYRINPETKAVEYPNFRARPMVKIVGDASGNARNTKATETDYDIICNALRLAGINDFNETPKENPGVRERVLTLNGLLKAMDGTINFFYNPVKCPKLKRDFDRVVWKKTGEMDVLDQKTDKTLTHASDSVGYPCMLYAPIELAGGAGKLHVIERKL